MQIYRWRGSVPKEMTTPSSLDAGWYVVLQGEAVDLDDWCHSLNEPFDPIAFQGRENRTILMSKSFDTCVNAEEVRSRALVLISRMNGAMALWNHTKPVHLGNVLKVDDDGQEQSFVFATVVGELRITGHAEAVVTDADGKTVHSYLSQPSTPQKWNKLAETNDDLSDMLTQLGETDNWIDLYKVLEIAAVIVGNKDNLYGLAADQKGKFRDMHQTANYHRHARGHNLPKNPPSLEEAIGMTRWLMGKVLEMCSETDAEESPSTNP